MVFNPTAIPEISVLDTERKITAGDDFVILDVRETWELARVSLKHGRVIHAPMSQLARQGVYALPAEVEDKQQEIVVICHHGVRSAEVTAWLLRLGWQRVCSMAGGVDAYAALVDTSIGSY
jgi:rhodanese-related sulfurtransferase